MPKALLVVLLLALVPVCGGDDDDAADDDTSIDDDDAAEVGLDDFVAAACAYLHGCRDAHGSPPYADEDACVDALLAATERELDAAEASGDVEIDTEALSACIDALDATPCDEFPEELRCAAAFAGTREEGDPCTSSFACGSGLSCTFEDARCARCRPAEDAPAVNGAFLGDPCSATRPCLGLFTACQDGACVGLPAEGEECRGRCVGGLGAEPLYCADSGECEPLPGVGDDCSDAAACAGEELRCSAATHDCEQALADGDDCDPDDDLCGAGLLCDPGTEQCAGACSE